MNTKQPEKITLDGQEFIYRDTFTPSFRWCVFRQDSDGRWFPMWLRRKKDAEKFVGVIEQRNRNLGILVVWGKGERT